MMLTTHVSWSKLHAQDEDKSKRGQAFSADGPR
jgi:hypothetical protein